MALFQLVAETDARALGREQEEMSLPGSSWGTIPGVQNPLESPRTNLEHAIDELRGAIAELVDAIRGLQDYLGYSMYLQSMETTTGTTTARTPREAPGMPANR